MKWVIVLCLFACNYAFGINKRNNTLDHETFVIYDYGFSSSSDEEYYKFIKEEFVFFHLFSKIATTTNCFLSLSPGDRGRVHFEGKKQEVWAFIECLLNTLDSKLNSEEIYEAKLDYARALEKNGVFFEIDLNIDTEWDDFSETYNKIKAYLTQLNIELRSEIRTMSGCEEDLQRFSNLRLNVEDQSNIRKLIKKLADMNWIDLLLHKKEMEKLGEKVSPVHPLRFTAFIYSDPELRNKKLPKIRNDSLKWRSFSKGFCDRMAKEHSNSNLDPFVIGFCYVTNNNPHSIFQYINNHQWIKIMESIIP